MSVVIFGQALASDFYMSKQGSDVNPGTLKEPFATLQHSLDQLQPGDALYIRGGVYYQDSVVTNVKGTASAPIVIQSYPGERAVFDASLPEFLTASDKLWQVIDEGKNIYKSQKAYVQGKGAAAAWLVDAERRYNDVKDSPYDVRLITYHKKDNLFSATCGDDDYVGPGLAVDEDGYYYIRLEQCPNDLLDETGAAIKPIPEQTDPNKIGLAVSNSTFILQLSDAAYVTFRGIDFQHATNMTPWYREESGKFECGYHPFIQGMGNIDITNGSHHITIDNSEIIFGNVGITVGLASSSCHNINIINSHIYQGFPDWHTWRDVKGGGNQFWPEGNSFAFSGMLVNSRFSNNMVHHTLDGMYITNGSRDSQIRENYFWMTRDDAINFGTYVSNLDVGWNMLRHVYEGISIVGYPYPDGANGGVNGDVFIHHNVIDVTKKMRRNRRPGEIWDPGKIWGAHSCSGRGSCENNLRRFDLGGDCQYSWTMYNNTIIASQRDITRNQTLFQKDSKHYKNNLMYMIDGLRWPGCDYCDGNLFWRKEGNCSNPDPNGSCFDPGFDSQAMLNAGYNPSNVFDLYLPSNPEVFTTGVELPIWWPDSQNSHRGAFVTHQKNN